MFALVPIPVLWGTARNAAYGRGVSYCALCDGNFFRDQVVAVVGGGNSALEEALYLSRIASKLYLIHRREGFRAAKVYQDKIRAASDKIELVLDTVVTGFDGRRLVAGASSEKCQNR